MRSLVCRTGPRATFGAGDLSAHRERRVGALTSVMTVVDTSSPLGALVHGNRARILEIAARHRARHVRVFGSVARGDAGDGSDIDFLVDFEPGSSLFDVLHLSEELQQLLDHPVDVVSVGGLKARDDKILAEAVEL